VKSTTIDEFYREVGSVPPDISKEVGHFNVFRIADVQGTEMPYNRRTYYKISLIQGKNIAEYADKVVNIEKYALLFATPRVPYHWLPQDEEQAGHFCVFTEDFMARNRSGVSLDALPIFQPGHCPIFNLSDEDVQELKPLFEKMHRELSSDYVYKYDLLRNYVLELIHYGQKLQPASLLSTHHNASARVSSLFIELLERQFPIESPRQKVELRTAKDYAERLSVHVNHLNKVLKEQTGNTTTALITSRIVQEAKILLKQTNWSISEIAFSLGFEEVSHFSNFFKRQTSLAPIAFRS
jgi:AraC-like DNA-binding protein